MKGILRLALAATLLTAPHVAAAQVLSGDQVSGSPGAIQGTATDGKRIKLPTYVPVRPDGTVIDPAGGGGGASVPTGTAGSPNAAVVSVQGVSGGTPQNVTVTNPTATGLTDAQLRATAVPVSGPLTDTQLRAAAVPVSQSGNFVVVGSVAAATADSGAPVKTGCFASTAVPTAVTAGQRQNTWCGLNGQAIVSAVTQASGADGVSNGSLGRAVAPDGTALYLGTYGYVFNGTTWDRNPGNTAGSFVVSKGSASLNTGQVSVGTNATLVAAARAGRGRINFKVGAANTCAFGNSGVTLTTGYALEAVAGASTSWETSAALYAICSATTTVSFVENF